MRTWAFVQPSFFLQWSCKGKRMRRMAASSAISKPSFFARRSRTSFARPPPPLTSAIGAMARIMAGLPVMSEATATSMPRKRLPASPIRIFEGSALYHRYPANAPETIIAAIAHLAASA